MSFTLGIDTSSTMLSLGLIEDGVPYCSLTRYVRNSHAEHITSAIKTFLDIAGITVSDITKCGVVVGPGSFTGIRIGLSFIKGLFITGETKIYPISSIENIAQGLSLPVGSITVALDAKQNNLFAASFQKSKERITRLTDDTKMSKELFMDQVKESDFIVYDTMGFKNSSVFAFLADDRRAIDINNLQLSRGLSAATIAEEAPIEDEKWQEAVNVFPNYMQESYAEQVRKK